MDNNEFLKTENLTIDFNGLIAVNKVNMTVNKNEIIGIIGPNGAGKTTFINLLSGFYKPVSGKIIFEGKDITGLSVEKRIFLGMSRTFQLVSVFPNLTVLENMTIAYYKKMNLNNVLFKALKEKTSLACNKYKKIKDYLELFGFTHIANKIVKNIPMGIKRELEVAMAIINDPKILFLDEPFAGLGDEEIDKLLILLRRFTNKKTVILIEHKISKIKDFVERIVVMNEGKKIADGNFDDVLKSQQVRKAYWRIN